MKCPSILLLILTVASTASGAELPAQLRYPVAAAKLSEQLLITANERSGTLSLVDMAAGRVTDEIAVGKRLTGIAVTQGGTLLVTDSAPGEIISLCKQRDGQWQPCARLKIEGDPSSIALSRNSAQAFVVSRWSRMLHVVNVTSDGKLSREAALPLPFPAGRIALVGDGQHLVVSEAFGGRLAVIDIAKREIVSLRETQGHNSAALVWDDENDRLLVPQQVLASSLPITLDNVQWGAVLKNVVRIITRKQLLDPQANLATQTHVIAIGQEGDGSADPTNVLPLANGSFAVALGGSDEVVTVESTGLVVQRVAVGRRPLALLAGAKKDELVVVNQFANALSMVDLRRGEIQQTVSLGPVPKLSPADRGEHLFYDARLSFEKWMSCHSCHTDGHTHGRLADTLGDNSFGAPKRTLTLLGTRDTDRWAWNGEVKELHDQVRKSIETSMHGEATADEVYNLTAFLHTLAPPPPLMAKPIDAADQTLVDRGRAVFSAQKCNECHIGPLTFTSHDVYDVGMPDENKHAKFNPPSLRGAGQASRYFHDGRATALEDVIDVFGHQVREPLTDDDRAALLRFLKSL